MDRHVTVANPDFNLEATLRTRAQAELDRELEPSVESEDETGLFSLSPMSSPDSTPPTSPALAPLTLDDIDTRLSSCNSRLETHQEGSKGKAKSLNHKGRRNANSRALRNKKRIAARASTYGHYAVREKVRERYIDHAEPIECEVDLKNSGVTEKAFVAKDGVKRSRKVHHVSEMVGEQSQYNFTLVEWDGHTPTPIIDQKRRLVTVLAGHPDDARWPLLSNQAARALEERRSRCRIPRKKRVHRRGDFIALNTGVSHGSGQGQPSNLTNPSHEQLLAELNEMEAFKRIAGFSSACMANWAPDLYAYYVTKLGELHEKDPTLRRTFPSSIFSATTYNFGPKTMAFKHVDFANLSFGWCAVTALGSFDPKKGGHLILWDLHLVVEFPPGSIILLPSAIVAHSNTSIAQHERRYSFVQYSAGGLFRWVENDCKKAVDFYASLSPERLLEVEAKNRERWQLGLSLFPVLKAPST